MGPYDATLIPRNTNYHTSPVAATMGTNKEALKATPNEYIRDALDKHVPLQGTAVVPSGMPGMDGKMMDYEEGADLMREPDAPGGAYRRWEGEKYLPEDLKGKGEPSYSIEKALKDHKHGKQRDPAGGIELQSTSKNGASRQRSVSLASPDGSGAGTDGSNDVRRSHSLKVGEGLKRRFGSLRKLRKQPDA
ncbi:hypothetical protein DH86_00002158 [Scytalidium sp. 3C]|nr:hypothetical protein DH86_00002158 [Scytalidium sp. 3C]